MLELVVRKMYVVMSVRPLVPSISAVTKFARVIIERALIHARPPVQPTARR